MKVLVTGGAGFLGTHLCRTLHEQGHEVTCLDNFSTGVDQDPWRWNWTLRDVRDPIPWEGELGEIYHLACPASPVAYQSDPIGTTLTCVLGAHNVLDLARRTGAKVLLTSTSEVYGDPDVHPQTEDYRGNVNPIGPRSCYDEGKRCAESLFFDHHRTYGTAIGVARIFNTYGPGMQPDDGRVVSTFIRQALAGEPLTIYGSGEQTRSFCYVDDMIDGLIRLMEADVTGPVNLGNPIEIPVNLLARLVHTMIGGACLTEYLPAAVDDPTQRRPDITRAVDLLDWRPRVSMSEGLERTIAWFRE